MLFREEGKATGTKKQAFMQSFFCRLANHPTVREEPDPPVAIAGTTAGR